MSKSAGGGGSTGSARRLRVWVAVAVVAAGAGTVSAVFAANAVARTNTNQAVHQFKEASAGVASRLQLAIQHEDDLIVNAGGFVAGNPDASNAQFGKWAASVDAYARYPELVGFGQSKIVLRSQLPAFAARAVLDPTGPLAADGTFRVTPAGVRPYYCLSATALDRDPQSAFPAGYDFCSGHLGAVSLASRDSGQSAYIPIKHGSGTLLSVLRPVYRLGTTPTTVAARREAFLGWFGMAVLPQIILARALAGQRHLAVTFTYHAGTSNAVFHSGKISSPSRSVTSDLNNGWKVQTFGPVAAGGIFNDGAALALLLAGTGMSLFFAVLVFVLATGRTRARRLVAERTAQLHGAQAQLVDSARQAGMAEIATNVLHNVGNVLNSVNVSADLVVQKVRGSRSSGLGKAVILMNEHADDLGFLSTDPRGKQLPGYLDQLATTLATERDSIDAELRRLTKGVGHIKEIVAAQQSLAGVSGVSESVRISELLEDALRLAGALDDHQVTVTRDVADDPVLALDKHRVLLILLNLISNATQAMNTNGAHPHQLALRAEVAADHTLRISVADNGGGIPVENLTRIFVHGFTTHPDGHGFGLHSAAIAAKEMGGTLTVADGGAVGGAVFTLQIPLQAAPVTV